MSGERVAVVGGGLAGVTAALDLADTGAAVTLLEARPRLGGATYSFTRDGLVLDNGQHVFLRCCTAYRALLRRLGVEHLTRLQSRLDVPVVDAGTGRTARLRRGRLPAPLHLAPALARYTLLRPADRWAAARVAMSIGRLDPHDPTVDDVPFAAWLQLQGQRERVVQALWQLVTVATLNTPVEEASLALAATVVQRGLLDGAGAADMGWATAPLGEVHGHAAERALRERHVDVRLGAKVAGLDDVAGFDAVVLAVPWPDSARLLPRPGLAALTASPIVNVHVVYDRRVTAEPVVAGVGTPAQWVFDRTAAAGVGPGQQCLAVSVSAADEFLDVPTAQLRQVFLPALTAVLPGAHAARVERFVVTRSKAATFRARTGTGRLRPGPVTDRPGVFLAGAWTDTGWPATMEGAVRSGHRAATAARRHLDTVTPTATAGVLR